MHEAHPVLVTAPLSLGQERIWLLTRLHGTIPALHERGGAWLDGEVGLADIEAAALEIARRHAILRTVIREEEGQPLQLWLMQSESSTQAPGSGTHCEPSQWVPSGQGGHIPPPEHTPSSASGEGNTQVWPGGHSRSSSHTCGSTHS